MFTLLDLSDRTDSEGMIAFDELSKVFRYFNKNEDVRKVLNDQVRNYRYSIPYSPLGSIRDLLKFMNRNIDTNIITKVMSRRKPDRYPVLDCEMCWSFDNVSKDVGAQNNIVPVTLLEYYDIATIKKTNQGKRYSDIRNSFDYVTAKSLFIGELNRIVDDAWTIAKKIVVVDPKTNKLNDPYVVDKIKSSYMLTFELSRLIDRLTTRLKVSKFMEGESDDQEMIELSFKIEKQLDTLNAYMCDTIALHKNNVDEIRYYVSTNTYRVNIRSNPKLLWYSTEDVNDILLLKDDKCNISQVEDIELNTKESIDEEDTLFPKNRRLTRVGESIIVR